MDGLVKNGFFLTFVLFDEVDEAFCPAFDLICKDIEFFDGGNTSEAMLVDAKDEDDDDDDEDNDEKDAWLPR